VQAGVTPKGTPIWHCLGCSREATARTSAASREWRATLQANAEEARVARLKLAFGEAS
jgi:predicted TPR repeat methyltransferase